MVAGRDEGAVGDQAVEVDVQVEGGTRPLDRRDGTAHPAAETAPPGAAALQAEDRTDEDREYGAAQAVVPGHGVQVLRALCHAPAAARRAEATPLAGGTRISARQPSHRKRTKPRAKLPHARKSRSSRSTKAGTPAPSARRRVASRNSSRCDWTTSKSELSVGERGT